MANSNKKISNTRVNFNTNTTERYNSRDASNRDRDISYSMDDGFSRDASNSTSNCRNFRETMDASNSWDGSKSWRKSGTTRKKVKKIKDVNYSKDPAKAGMLAAARTLGAYEFSRKLTKIVKW
jgi:hypothetical protein